MTTISIVPENPGSPTTTYRAVAGSVQSVGKTPGQALDALTAQIGTIDSSSLILVRQAQPDEFFTAEQQQRLAELMARWRAARDGGPALTPEERTELDALAQAELRASGARAAALAQRLTP